MKPVQPPLVVLATSIPITLFVIWWLYKKRIMKEVDQNEDNLDNNAEDVQLMATEHPRNGLLPNSTEMKKSLKKCDMCPVPQNVSNGAKDDECFDKRVIIPPYINHVEADTLVSEITFSVTTCKDNMPSLESEKPLTDENETLGSLTEHVQTEEKSILKLSGVQQQRSPECSKTVCVASIEAERFSEEFEERFNAVNTVLENVSTSATLNHKEDAATPSSLSDISADAKNSTDAEESFSNLSNIELTNNDTYTKQNISEITQLTLETNGCCNNNDSSSLSTNDTQLSGIRPNSPISTQKENELSPPKSDSIGADSLADTAESLQIHKTEEVNGTSNNIDSYADSQTILQTVSSNESSVEVKNEQNNNTVDVDSKLSSTVDDIGDLVSMAVDETQPTEDSVDVPNDHKTEHLNMCNGDNHSTLDNMNDDSSCFYKDERQIYLEFPSEKVGLLIGKMGRNIKQLKQDSGADIMVHTVPFREDIQVLQIVGTNASVDMAASSIQKRFREVHLKEFDYSNTVDMMSPNLLMPSPPTSSSPSFAYPVPEMTQLKLPDGISVEVVVSAIADCDCIFVQQYTHPTFHALASLEHAMSLCYSSPSTPALLSPVQVGLVCVAQHMDTWYRAQVIHSNEDLSNITIKFVDYGGYSTVPTSTVKQIRADFITLPFQAAECYLDNISPPLGKNSYSPDSTRFLQELLKEGEFHAAISRYRDDGIPCIRLYKKHCNRTTLVNDILVNEGIAQWVAADGHDVPLSVS